MYSAIRFMSRGALLTALVLVFVSTAIGADMPHESALDANLPASASQEELQPGLNQLERDAAKIPEREVQKTDRELEQKVGRQPHMSVDPATKDYVRMN